MYENLSIDELVERYQDEPEDEGVEMLREIARRYREGIGVEADKAEALRWEELIPKIAEENSGNQEPQKNMDTKSECNHERYLKMSEQKLYRAFREGKPWAIYYFSLKLVKNHEEKTALAELEELSRSLESKLESGKINKDLQRLLALTKIAIASIYESDNNCPNSTQKAQKYYEEAALELRCRDAIPGLLRCYRTDGFDKHEKETLSLLRILENGDINDKIVVAETYKEMGLRTYATLIYNELINETELEECQKLKIIEDLMEMGAISKSEIKSRSLNGDGIATIVLAREAYAQLDYTRAERLFLKALQQDDGNVAKEEYAKFKESQLKNREIKKRESERIKNERKEQRNREFLSKLSGWRKQWKPWLSGVIKDIKEGCIKNPMLAILCACWIIGPGIGGIAYLYQDYVDSYYLETIDVFEDVQVNYLGAVPDTKVQIINTSDNEFLQSVSYSASPSYGVKNGDKVRIYATYSKPYAKKVGYKVKIKSKTYKVHGLGNYIADIKQISSDSRLNMEMQALEMVRESIENYSAHDLMSDLTGQTYECEMKGTYNPEAISQETAYFLKRKSGYTKDSYNRYIVTYEVPLQMRDNDTDTLIWDAPAYFSVVFTNLVRANDGEKDITYENAEVKKAFPTIDDVYVQRVGRFKEQYDVQVYNP